MQLAWARQIHITKTSYRPFSVVNVTQIKTNNPPR